MCIPLFFVFKVAAMRFRPGNSLFILALAVLLAVALYGHGALRRIIRPVPLSGAPMRIVSLAPSITETLYALGVGDRVVGITQFCAWPPEVVDKPRVAGFSDVNAEAVLRTRPDLIVVPHDKERIRREMEQLGLPVLAVDVLSLDGLADTVTELGRVTGREEAAAGLVDGFHRAIERAQARALGKARPRVLFAVMHAYEGLGYISEINVVGQDGFFSELLRIAGGENVYEGPLAFPRLSREAVIFLNPDVIVDVIPEVENVHAVVTDWKSLSAVNALRDDRLVLLTDTADTVPGPRFVQTLERLSLALHPQGGTNVPAAPGVSAAPGILK